MSKKIKFWLALVILITVSSFSLFWGFKTGVPSDERLVHELGGRENVVRKEKQLRAFINTGKYVRSEFIPKNQKLEMAEMSPYFDQLRSYYPDEQYILKILAKMAAEKDFQPSSFIYGPFFFYQSGAGIFAAKIAGQLPKQTDAVYFMENPGDFAPVYLGARLSIIITAILAVVVTFLIGLELKNFNMGFIAALMLSSVPLFNMVGKFIKPDMPCLCWSACVLLFSVYVYKHGRLRDYLLAGAAVALAAGSKYPGVLSCFYVAAFFLARNYDLSRKFTSNLKEIFKIKEFKYLCGSGLACVLVFIITNPSCILRYHTFRHDVSWIAGVLREGSFVANIFEFLKYFILDGFFYNIGPSMLIIFFAGIAFIIYRRDKIYLAMLPVIVLFIIMASRGSLGSDAYLMPVLVPLSLIGASLVVRIRNKALLWTAVAFIVIPSFGITFAYDAVAAGENARLKASRWINENVPTGSSIARVQYPVSYRTVMANPELYPQYSMDIQPEKARSADYFIDSSFERMGAPWGKRFDEKFNSSLPPSEDFVTAKVIESIPMVFGFIPLRRYRMLNPYIETISPRIVIFKRKSMENVRK